MKSSEWEEVKLGDIAFVTKLAGFEYTKYLSNNFQDKGVPVIQGRNIKNRSLNLDKAKYITEELSNSLDRSKIKFGDILFSFVGTVGDVYLHDSNNPLHLGSNVAKISILKDNEVFNKFIYYTLQGIDSINKISSKTKGTVQSNINMGDLRSIEIKLPSFSEQKVIANVLSTLDEKIEVNNQINKTLENMAQTVFKHWFVDFEFPDEKGNPYKSSGGKMVESELGMIPMEWETACLSEIGDIVAGGTPSKTKNEYYENGNIAWITPKDLSGNKGIFISEGATNVTELGLKKSSAKILPKYSVLFSSRAPIGYLAINKNEVCTNQGFKSIVPNEGIPYQFVYFYLKNSIGYIESIAGGSTFKEISGTAMKNLKVTLPPRNLLKEYKQIVETIFNNIENYEDISQILSEFRDAVLPKLLSGEIEIPTEEEA